ncbi:ATP-binding protein [Actinomadura rupiterrae]|uniref:ATP-binding protein n=1 Tax=Actinomadura rupiterrae TaxID=559627 RepID=UPI0020A55416|nr:ATP-binding protein [Actinomadura rupiterrae]MCP2341543.1 anti-sigma regulatory factor (Ser/Thr protein kinase) [Actinomadura rupiterrae]
MTVQLARESPTPHWIIDRTDERGLKDARDFLGDVLGVMGCDADMIYIGKTIMTELATNALVHTANDAVPVRVVVAEDGRPVIEVEDGSDARPQIRPIIEVADERDSLAEHFDSGRGLAMIAKMAAYWGWSMLEGRGKVVWAALPTVVK